MSFSSPRAGLMIGLALGLALGLFYTWVIDPVEITNTYPALLRSDHQEEWTRLTALSYVASGDLEQARARLEDLDREIVAGVLETLIEEYAAAGRSAETLRRLTTLAQAMDVHTPAMLIYLETTASPSPTSTSTTTPSPRPTATPTFTPRPTNTPTSTPTPTVASPLPTDTPEVTGTLPSPTPTVTLTPTATPIPTSTPTPTPTPPLLERLRPAEREQVCESGQSPRIEVVVQDEDGEGVPGVEVWLSWSDGADRAVTGLKPDQGPGYVDFNVDPDLTYAISVGELGMPLVTGLRIETCPVEEGEEPFMGSWRIVLTP